MIKSALDHIGLLCFLKNEGQSLLSLFHTCSDIRYCNCCVWLCSWTMSRTQFTLTGKYVVPSTHNWMSFRSLWQPLQKAVRRLWQEQYKSSVQIHLHLLTKQLRESNILPSPVFSPAFTLPPSSPLQASFISNSCTNGASLHSAWGLS